VYGDHVELSAMDRTGEQWREHGEDFASTIGTGGVVGTKFVWPELGAHYKEVNLTSHKDEVWKKWIELYNEKMLSKGNFLDLYTYGYDTPEAYAIEKDGTMYYAFYAPQQSALWKGEVELRGLKPGTYTMSDYANGKSLGTVESAAGKIPKLAVSFTGNLLLEAAH
jgi:alpha-galactosidase